MALYRISPTKHMEYSDGAEWLYSECWILNSSDFFGRLSARPGYARQALNASVSSARFRFLPMKTSVFVRGCVPHS
jgi:hypothetical protein